MKNKLIDLNNHLFASLERLSEEELTGDRLSDELKRAHAVATTAHAIIDNARLCLDAHLAVQDPAGNLPQMLCAAVTDQTKK